MIRGIKKNQLIIMFLLSLGFAGVINYAFSSFAAAAPQTTLLDYKNGVPINGGSVTASAVDNKFKAVFRVKANDVDSPNGLFTQVVYKKSTDASWKSFGTTAITGPDGKKTLPNGVTSVFSDAIGRNCQMGWNSWPQKPANCNSVATGPTGRTGLPAWDDYPIYSSAVYLSPGTYYWTARSTDRSLYGGWSEQWSFVVKSYPEPTCSLLASPVSIKIGEQTNLTWSTINAASVSSSWSGGVPQSGAAVQSPTADTTYSIVAKNGAGTKTCMATVRVTQQGLLAEESSNAKLSGSSTAIDEDSEKFSGQDVAGDKNISTAVGGQLTETATDVLGAPENLKAEFLKKNSSVLLSWDTIGDDPDTTTYVVEKKEKNKNFWEYVSNSYKGSYADLQVRPNRVYEYRVKKSSFEGGTSDYSNIAEVNTESIDPNVIANQESQVRSEDGRVLIVFPAYAAIEDMLIIVEKIDPRDYVEEAKLRKLNILGSIYNITARNREGDEIRYFRTQIQIKFSSGGISGSTRRLAKITTTNSSGEFIFFNTVYSSKNNAIETLTNHLSPFFLTAHKTSPLIIFLRVIMWVLVVAGIFGGGFWFYKKKQLDKYQKEHREDYIYKH